MSVNAVRWPLAVLSVAAAAAGCGGGSGAGGFVGPAPNPTYTAGLYQTPLTYTAHCAMPRAGTDPVTHQAYPDVPGSVVWENFWTRSWINAYYLWYTEAPDLDPAAYGTAADYFAADKTPALTLSGTPKDHFHFTYATAQWQALSQSGVSVGYGVTWSLISPSVPRKVVAAYTEPNSPATAPGANLVRGATVLTVDGVDVVNSADKATLNAGLFPLTVGETHTFTILDPGTAQGRAITMIATSVTGVPVQDIAALPTSTGKVGYLLFNDHIATAEAELVQAIDNLQAAGVTDLVLDIRYNGGGFLDIASELAYMIAGRGPTAGRTFDLVTFNNRYPTTDPISGQPLTPTPFHSVSQGFSSSIPPGQPLPSLNLGRVFVLTGPDTCSASEAIINSLRGVNVQVILIGSQTCGKPYGFYPQDNCGTTYFSIEFKGVNALGFGDYSDGFVAQNTTSATGVQVPGCSVADDYAHALGDPAESRLAAALAYRASNGTACPTPPSGLAAPQAPLSVDGQVVKPEWLKNRIRRPLG